MAATSHNLKMLARPPSKMARYLDWPFPHKSSMKVGKLIKLNALLSVLDKKLENSIKCALKINICIEEFDK